MIRIKQDTFRHILLAAGVAALLASILMFYHQHIAYGFFLAFIGLSSIGNFETDIDFNAKYSLRSFRKMLGERTYVSTLGALCNILAWLCLAAAGVSCLQVG